MATESIGTRIAKRRQVLGLTQAQLAEQAGVTESSVVNWETGKHFPRRKLGVLEQVLGITLTEDSQADVYTDPGEAAIWNMGRFTPDERRAMITALREERRAAS